MKLNSKINLNMEHIVATYDEGEKYLDIKGEKFIVTEVKNVYIDNRLIKCDIQLRQIITLESIEVVICL